MSVSDRNFVATGDGEHAVGGVGQRPGRRKVGALVADPFGADGDEAPLGVKRELALEFDGAAVVVGGKTLRTRANPFDRLAQRLGGVHQRRILLVRGAAHAEATAHIERMDADVVLRDTGDLR